MYTVMYGCKLALVPDEPVESVVNVWLWLPADAIVK